MKNLWDCNMKTLYESILDNTKDKVDATKETISCVPPTNKDWRKVDNYSWVIDYKCKPLIDKYIDIIPNALFDGTTSCNPFKIKRDDITTIRCVVKTKSGNQRCYVELCTDKTGDGDMGVVGLGLCEYLNGCSVANAKKLVVEYFNRVFEDSDLLGRTFEIVKKEVETLVKWGHSVGGKAVWNIR